MAASMRSLKNAFFRIDRDFSWSLVGAHLKTHYAQLAHYATTPTDPTPPRGADTVKTANISKAMQAYLMNARDHDKMLTEYDEEFERGKHHLARMMDVEPENFTQEDIDRAVRYLLPSGLYSKGARPIMKPASFIYPKRKAAEFDESGRPYHYQFYTSQSNFYELMHNILDKIHNLDSQLKAADLEKVDKLEELRYGHLWLDSKTLEERILEKLDEKMYERFVILMDKLLLHPLAYKEASFLRQYRRPLAQTSLLADVPPREKCEETGREFAQAIGARKRNRVQVRVYQNGTGLFSIENEEGRKYDLDFFMGIFQREQILSPLTFVNKIGLVDIECKIIISKESHITPEKSIPCQTGLCACVRHGVSLCLAAFEDDDTKEMMRQVGLLTLDHRYRERKKPGQKKARKKKTWKKR